jgi:hypothetical protein
VRVARVATPWDLQALEQALLQGQGGPGFAPGPVSGQRRSEEGVARVLGSAHGEQEDGDPFRVDYALLDLGPEKVVARYLGSPDDVAFNLSLVRRSLETLEAAPLLTRELEAPLKAALEPALYPGGARGSVLLPAGWSQEPAVYASCARVPGAETGVAASPVGDFTVVFRVLRWTVSPGGPEEMARACGGVTGSAYSGRFERLGGGLGAWGTFVHKGGELLLLEAEAPEEKLPFVRDLYLEWLDRVRE